MRGLGYLESGEPEKAVVALRGALELDPGMADAWNDLGVVMEALGNPYEALRCYRRTLNAAPLHAEARSNLTLLTLQMGMAQALRRQAFTSSLAY